MTGAPGERDGREDTVTGFGWESVEREDSQDHREQSPHPIPPSPACTCWAIVSGTMAFCCSFSLQSAIKGLTMGGLEVISITDNTPIPHNGCRPRKARRL